MQTFMEIIGPVLAALLTALIPLLIGALVQWFRKLGIDIEAQHRDALQSALTNAALLAISKGMGSQDARKLAALAAVDYVRGSVPDAVDRFGLDDQAIVRLLGPRVAAARLKARGPIAQDGGLAA